MWGLSFTLDGRKTWTFQQNSSGEQARFCLQKRLPVSDASRAPAVWRVPCRHAAWWARTVSPVELSVPRQATTPMNSHRVPALHLVAVPLAVHQVACSLPRGRTRAARETLVALAPGRDHCSGGSPPRCTAGGPGRARRQSSSGTWQAGTLCSPAQRPGKRGQSTGLWGWVFGAVFTSKKRKFVPEVLFSGVCCCLPHTAVCVGFEPLLR